MRDLDLKRPIRKNRLLSVLMLGVFLVLVAVLAVGLLMGRFRDDLDYAISGSVPVPTRRPAARVFIPPKLTFTKVRTRVMADGRTREVMGEIQNDSQQTVRSIVVDLSWEEPGQHRSAKIPVIPEEIPPGGLGYFQAPFAGLEAGPVMVRAPGADWSGEPNESHDAPTAVPSTPAPSSAPAPTPRSVSEESLCLRFDAIPGPRTGAEIYDSVQVAIRNGCDHEVSSSYSRFHIVARARDDTPLAETDGQCPEDFAPGAVHFVPVTLYCDPARVYRYAISRLP